MIGMLLWSVLAAGDPAPVNSATGNPATVNSATVNLATGAPTADELRFFETSIRPVLVDQVPRPQEAMGQPAIGLGEAMLRGGRPWAGYRARQAPTKAA